VWIEENQAQAYSPMKITSATFELSAAELGECPKWALPEFAFIGRSNVGKSSLINLLAERNGLAKVSDKPGKTKLINFFVLNRAWSLVDLPGYGYAAVAQKQRIEFTRTISDYLQERRNLYFVFLLIDSRLPPQGIDLDFIRWLAAVGRPFAVIFTKIDKASAAVRQATIAAFTAAVAAEGGAPLTCFTSSARTRAGRTDILNWIQSILVQNNRA
jgi:GTP-binding protein